MIAINANLKIVFIVKQFKILDIPVSGKGGLKKPNKSCKKNATQILELKMWKKSAVSFLTLKTVKNPPIF